MARTSATSLPGPLAYLNGKWLPLAQAAVSVYDIGFVQGVTVAEQLRTFGGRLFRLDLHLDRLARSLAIIGVDLGLSRAELEQIATELAAQNHKLLDPADDLGLTMFVTPGPQAAFAHLTGKRGPTVCIHTQPLPFHTWAGKYESGDMLVVSPVMQVPGACWPPELKCRSRMHYFLADLEAAAREPGARALLLDERGLVTEASTANILVYFRDEGLVSPPREQILPGVTVAVLEELAASIGIPFAHRDLTADDVAAADEVLLCSTSPCVWSVTRLDGRPIADGQPGPIARQLRDAWCQMVGVDLVTQASQFAIRS
jgi:branched-subunit amino acid aminotransferase/4-amino-4-deoxychorismate lyase